MNYSRLMMALCAFGLMGGCEIFSTSAVVEVMAPSPPQLWIEAFGEPVYEMEWYDGERRRRSRRLSGGSATIIMPRLLQTPVVLTPITAGGLRLPAAGAIYPLQIDDDGVLHPTWQDGAAVALLLRLYPSLNGFPSFNVGRFLREVWERTDGQPWRLDETRIVEGLPEGVIRADYIRPRPLFPVEIEAPAGTWEPVDPFEPSTRTLSVGGRTLLRFESLPTGLHRYLNIVRAERLDLFVDEGGGVSHLMRRLRH